LDRSLLGTILIKQIRDAPASDYAFAKLACSMLKGLKMLLRNAVGRGGAKHQARLELLQAKARRNQASPAVGPSAPLPANQRRLSSQASAASIIDAPQLTIITLMQANSQIDTYLDELWDLHSSHRVYAMTLSPS